jgi:magnesium chelatase family protein
VARALPSILPRLTADEALEVTRIYSVAGRLREHGPVIRRRPFRAPHHTISRAGLVGGGVGRARPGELSLAHRGVLFLDELPEFGHEMLEVKPSKCRWRTGAVVSHAAMRPAGDQVVAPLPQAADRR